MVTVIETKELYKSFGGHVVIDKLDFKVKKNEFVSVIGPNGAGKTTFFNLLSGQLKSTSGEIFFKEKKITSLPTPKRVNLGIGRSFQLTNIFPNLTVLENVRLAVQSRLGIKYQMFKHYQKYKDVINQSLELLELVLLEKKKDSLASSLTHGEKRKLEIALLLALDSELLLLDEPTAGMSLEEVPIIIDIIKEIKKIKNKTIILIEHKMDLVIDLSDRICVLYNGNFIADGTPDEIMKNEIVQTAYLGGEL